MSKNPTLVRVSVPAMGSLFEIYLGGDEATSLEHLGREALERVRWWETRLNHFDPQSDISQINANALHNAFPVPSDLFALLQTLRKLSEQTEGAFDCTTGQLVRLWGLFRQGTLLEERVKPPDTTTLQQIVQEIGWQKVELDSTQQTIRFHTPAVSLHLGAIGKGYVVDIVADFLRNKGVDCALIQSGFSSLYAIGSPPGQEGWRVGIADPLDETRSVAQVVLRDVALSTSGSAESLQSTDGDPVSHIFDPRTGLPVSRRGSVSVLSPDATTGEAFATAFFVQGEAWTAQFCQANPHIEALFVEPQPETVLPTLTGYGATARRFVL